MPMKSWIEKSEPGAEPAAAPTKPKVPKKPQKAKPPPKTIAQLEREESQRREAEWERGKTAATSAPTWIPKRPRWLSTSRHRALEWRRLLDRRP
jgi:hypothetical protein